jgi:hypothetical protein
LVETVDLAEADRPARVVPVGAAQVSPVKAIAVVMLMKYRPICPVEVVVQAQPARVARAMVQEQAMEVMV